MPLWPNKRETLAKLLTRSGFVPALERLAQRPGLVVLCYHRLGDAPNDPFYSPLISASPDAFREQMGQLRKVFHLLSLEQAIEALSAGGPRRPSALVTFDDGYRDNLSLAAPILTDLEVPAALFVTTGFLDAHLPWWDHVAAVVKRSSVPRLRLDRPEPLDLDCSDGPSHALTAVILAYLRADRPDNPALIEHLEDRAEVKPDAGSLARELFLSWEDVRAWLDSGFSVGAHTRTHRRLSKLSESEQRAELDGPKQRIERELGRPVEALAYPFGDPSAFDAQTKRIALETGYRAAFALRPGVSGRNSADLFDVPRFNVMGADSPSLLRARLALAGSVGRSVV